METIIISIIATIISLVSLSFCIKTYFKQYGKSVKVQFNYRVAVLEFGKMKPSFCISVANTSQFSIFIKEIGIYSYSDEIKDFEYIWLGCIEPDYDENPIKIMPQESKDFYFDINLIIKLINKNVEKGLTNKKVKIAIRDSTNKIYIKKDFTNEVMKTLLK